jgi:DNA-binding transcriptional MocR family regulator
MVVSEHSINAKLLYALLLNRTIKQMANDLNRSERTVKTALCELENAGLLTRVRQGLTKANRLFLQIPDGVQLSSPLMGKGCLSEVQKTAPLDGQKLPTSNTNTEYKEQEQPDSCFFELVPVLRVPPRLCKLGRCNCG